VVASATLGLALLGPAATPTPATAAGGGGTATPTNSTQVVGGTATTVASVPWQARLRARLDGRPWADAAAARYTNCGAVVISPTVLVTAAHCVFEDRVRIPPRSMRVDTGISRFSTKPADRGEPQPLPADTRQTVAVASVRRHPGYPNLPEGPSTPDMLVDDVATLTLASPLKFDENTRPIALADPGGGPTSGPATTSGFGLQSGGAAGPNGRLYALGLGLTDPALGDESYSGAVNALYVSAKAPGGTTCPGDSGGPLVSGGRLVGIVSSGDIGCDPGTTSRYTNVAAPEIRDFILGSNTPPLAPRGGGDVSLSGSARAGDALRCAPGTWTNGPTFVFTFTDTRDGAVLQEGPGDVYAVQDGDVGRTIACRTTATTAGGVGRSLMSGVTPPVIARPAAPPPPVANPARLRVQTAVGSSRVRRRGRVAFALAVDNVGGEPARSIRTCVTVGTRFTVSSRGKGRLRGRTLCWTTKTLKRRVVKRFVLRAKSTARTGRITAVRVQSKAPSIRTAYASRRITIRR
jgi:trypsin